MGLVHLEPKTQNNNYFATERSDAVHLQIFLFLFTVCGALFLNKKLSNFNKKVSTFGWEWRLYIFTVAVCDMRFLYLFIFIFRVKYSE